MLVVAVALLGAPHSHADRLRADLSAYALPDGTLPVLCTGLDEDHRPDPEKTREQACIIACQAAMLPVLLPAAPVLHVPAELDTRDPLPANIDPPTRSSWAEVRARAPPVIG